MTAIDHCPKNILILSTFDFSLYLQNEVQHLLKNHTSTFVSQKISAPSRPAPRPLSRTVAAARTPSTKMTQMHGLLKQTLGPRPSYRLESPPSSSRRLYRLELPRFDAPSPPPSPPFTPSSSSYAKQYEYDEIDVPQKFSSDLQVDWRLISLVLWSKCYCRYDQNSMPTLAEQELTLEISSLQAQIENQRENTREPVTIDAFHSVSFSSHANASIP